MAIWIGLIVLGFIVQSTEGFGSLGGLIAWFVLGGAGFLALLAFGAERLIGWLIDRGGLGDRESNAGCYPERAAGGRELAPERAE